MAKSKNTGLGRGLDSVFLDNAAEPSDTKTLLRISDIEPNRKQPRKTFDTEALSKLADSIATHGVLQPIAVRSEVDGFYTIVAGERRWRAAKMAGLSEVPVIIMELDDKKAAEIALVENLQREDLSPLEEAMAYKALIDEFALTQEEVAKRIGKSRAAIANTLRLLELPDEIAAMIAEGQLTAGHGRALLGLNNDIHMLQLAENIAKYGLSVRAAEDMVRKQNAADAKPSVEVQHDPDEVRVDYIASLEKKMQAALSRGVKIRAKGKTKRLEIEFTDNRDLETIITRLCGDNILDE